MFYYKFIEKKNMLLSPTAAVKSPVKGLRSKGHFFLLFFDLQVGTSIHDELVASLSAKREIS